MAKRLSIAEGLTSQQAAFPKQGKQIEKQISKQTIQPATLTTFTVRLPLDIVNELRQVAVARKVAGASPASQQEIIEDAVRQWLEDNR
jgi:hypothetical protein